MFNCLYYAFAKLLIDGGSIVIKSSRLKDEFNIHSLLHPLSWFPHIQHIDRNGVLTEYTITKEMAANHSKAFMLYKLIFGSLIGILVFIAFCYLWVIALVGILFFRFDGVIIEHNKVTKGE